MPRTTPAARLPAAHPANHRHVEADGRRSSRAPRRPRRRDAVDHGDEVVAAPRRAASHDASTASRRGTARRRQAGRASPFQSRSGSSSSGSSVAEPLLGLDGEREQQRGHRGADDDVGQGQGLHHGVDCLRVRAGCRRRSRRRRRCCSRSPAAAGRSRTAPPTGRSQVDQVVAGHDPVEPDQEIQIAIANGRKLMRCALRAGAAARSSDPGTRTG